MLRPGEQVHHYIIEEPVGGGGMARVYRVRHAILGHALALKVLDPFWVDKPQVRRRFLAEGRIQAMVRHPAIVLVTDAVVDASRGIAGLVMEYVEGPNLQQVMERSPGPSDPGLIRDVMLPILEGMHHVHQEGVVHRDLKPANVLLSRDAAGRWHPRVVDFGVAHVADPDLLPPSHRTTKAGALLGTPAFMAPEQARGEQAEPRWDVFSLGVILYELLTGAHPFEGEDDEGTLARLKAGDLVPATDALPGLRPALAEVVDRALAVDPEGRFPSCAAFARALEAALALSPATDASPSPDPAPAPSAPPAAALVVGHRDRFPLPAKDCTVGSGAGADVELPDGAGVEPIHCHVAYSAEGWTLEDRSTSGSRVNGARVHRVLLAHGDLLRLGHQVLRFEVERPPGAQARAATAASPLPPRPRAARPALEHDGQRFPIPPFGSVVVGRGEDVDLHIDEPEASPHHCRVSSQGVDVVVEDLDSANGTLVDGQRVRFRTLRGGEIIEVGATRILFHRR